MKVRLTFDSFQSFLDECSDRISEQGIFLATEAIEPVGSRVEFHLGLDDDFPILKGSGEVVWVVGQNGEGETPGMAVRYDRTDEATATLARRIAERQRAGGGAAFELDRPDAGEPAPDDEAAAVAAELEEEPPSPATQRVDELILDANVLEPEPEPEPEPESEPERELEEPAIPEPAPVDEATTETYETQKLEPLADGLETAALETAALEAETAAFEVETAGGEPEPEVEVAETPRRRAGLWATLGLIVALSAVAYWQRGLLLQMLGGGSQESARPAAAESEPAAPAAPAEPETVDVVEPEVQVPVEPEVQVPAEPAPATAAEDAPAAAPSGPLSVIEEIRWQAIDGGTLVQLVADGTFTEDGYQTERLVDPPRVLLKVQGVTAPLATPTVAVGSEEVVGIRTALHGSPPSTSLHVVVDLADPTAELTATRIDGALLQMRIASSAISP